MKKRIMILTADAGFGHRSAAAAVEAALVDKYGGEITVEIVNPLDDKRAPFLLRDSQTDYDKIIRNAPELYKLGYDASDATVVSTIMESVLTIALWEVMRDLLKKYRPDAIFSTYPMYQAPLSSLFSVFRTFVPLLAAVTDLATVHRMWFNANIDTLLVPNTIVRDLAVSYGVAPEKIYVSGIPVHPSIAQEKRSKSKIRHALGWQTDLTTILAVGSRRVENLMEVLNVINHFGAPLQLAVVAGKDDEMYTELKQMEWHIPVHLYDFVTNMPELMHAADLMVSKAGGLIITEALACGLPMMLIDVIPGQETGNMEYILSNRAGVYADLPMDALIQLAHCLENGGALLREYANNACQLGRPAAAYDAADLIWNAAQQGLTRMESNRRTPLLDLLTAHQIPWGEEDFLPEQSEQGTSSVDIAGGK